MMNFVWKFMVIAVVCVLAASFVAPYAAAQQTSSFTINSNSLFVGDQGSQSVKLVNVQSGVTSNFATTNINGPRGIIFTGGDSPAMLVANQVPCNACTTTGDIAKYDPSNGNFLSFLVPQSSFAPFAPRGIVLSPNHSVLYVADFQTSSTATSGLIRTYNANNGHPIASYSAQALLSPFGDNFSPRGIVFGPNGLLYISVFDTVNPLTGYILTFNPSTSAFNILVRSDAANNYDNFAGGAGMHRPEGIVFDPSGNLWVTSFCAKDKQGDCSNALPTPQTSPTNVDKIMEFDPIHGNLINSIPLETSTKVPRTYSQVILFGPNLGGSTENLYVPIQSTGELRVYDTSPPFAFSSVVQPNTGSLIQPWYLSFRGTDPSTLAYNPLASSSPSFSSSTTGGNIPGPQQSLIPQSSLPIPSQPNSRPFQP